MTRSRLVLLDANIVIRIFELGIWEQITKRCEVVLAQTVVDEAEFYDTDAGREYIDWERWIRERVMRVESVSAADVQAFCKQFDAGYYEKLDPGEAESLVLLERESDARICSADKIVWRVLGNTNKTDRGVSLEEILQQIGLTKSLPDRFSKRFREHWCREGSREHFMGQGDQGA